MFSPKPVDPEGAKHNFYFHAGGTIFVESDDCSNHKYRVTEKRLIREFGEFKFEVDIYLTDEYESDNPKIWQKWWSNQMVGNDVDDDDGPWTSPNHGMRTGPVGG